MEIIHLACLSGIFMTLLYLYFQNTQIIYSLNEIKSRLHSIRVSELDNFEQTIKRIDAIDVRFDRLWTESKQPTQPSFKPNNMESIQKAFRRPFKADSDE